MKLYKIKVLHGGPKDSHESIDSYITRENDEEVFKYLEDSGGWEEGNYLDIASARAVKLLNDYIEWIQTLTKLPQELQPPKLKITEDMFKIARALS